MCSTQAKRGATQAWAVIWPAAQAAPHAQLTCLGSGGVLLLSSGRSVLPACLASEAAAAAPSPAPPALPLASPAAARRASACRCLRSFLQSCLCPAFQCSCWHSRELRCSGEKATRGQEDNEARTKDTMPAAHMRGKYRLRHCHHPPQ